MIRPSSAWFRRSPIGQILEIRVHLIPGRLKPRSQALPAVRSARAVKLEMLQVRHIERIFEARIWPFPQPIGQSNAPVICLLVAFSQSALRQPGKRTHLNVEQVWPFLELVSQLREFGHNHAREVSSVIRHALIASIKVTKRAIRSGLVRMQLP